MTTTKPLRADAQRNRDALLAKARELFADGARELEQVVTDLLAAGVEEGTVRDDVGAGAVPMVLQGICSACGHPGSRGDADGAVTLVLDGLHR